MSKRKTKSINFYKIILKYTIKKTTCQNLNSTQLQSYAVKTLPLVYSLKSTLKSF